MSAKEKPTTYNARSQKFVDMLIARGGFCQWQEWIPNSATGEKQWRLLERWQLGRHGILMQVMGEHGIDVYVDDQCPHEFAEIDKWLDGLKEK